ncbi:MAG TPA: hypothetical protein VKH42_06645 [Vicinamibacterales bacterium]|nr:hypothetical protein [Vicinamibacterales bacterium]
MAEVHQPRHGDPEGRHPIEHEATDVDIRPVLGFLAGLTVASVFIGFLVWILFAYLTARESRTVTADYPLAAQQDNRLPPEPRLQTQPREDLRELRAREDEMLTTYGWVDKNQGVVRIPIDQAMRMVVERGLPTRAGSEPKR